MVETFSYNYDWAYKVSSSWKTIIDEYYSGSEQRRNQWTSSRKKWVLEFDKNNTDTEAIMAFFDARKGSYEAFYWVWTQTDSDGIEKGGDGVTYLVRFADDELNIEHIVGGYTKFSITLVQVVS